MKEAAGEANLTVVAIILVAAVVAIATPLVASLMKTAPYRACCTDAGGVWKDGVCTAGSDGYSQEDCKKCITTNEGDVNKCAAN